MNIYCANCEHACSEMAAACPECGHPLSVAAEAVGKTAESPVPEAALPPKASRPAPTRDETVYCPECKALINNEKDTCEKCGADWEGMVGRQAEEAMIARAVERGIQATRVRSEGKEFRRVACYAIWGVFGIWSLVLAQSSEPTIGVILGIHAAAFLLIASRPMP